MYKLEIETNNRLKVIRNPKKVRYKNRLLWYSVQVMEQKGRWRIIGRCLSLSDALSAIGKIERSIKSQATYVYVNIS